MNRRMPNGTYGGVRGARDYPLLDSLKNLFERSSTMIGLEIVMNIDTLEIFDVIDHDKNGNSEQELTTIQLSLFDSMTCI